MAQLLDNKDLSAEKKSKKNYLNIDFFPSLISDADQAKIADQKLILTNPVDWSFKALTLCLNSKSQLSCKGRCLDKAPI